MQELRLSPGSFLKFKWNPWEKIQCQANVSASDNFHRNYECHFGSNRKDRCPGIKKEKTNSLLLLKLK